MRFSIFVRVPNMSDLVPLDINDNDVDPIICKDLHREILTLLKISGEKNILLEDNTYMKLRERVLIPHQSLSDIDLRNGDIIDVVFGINPNSVTLSYPIEKENVQNGEHSKSESLEIPGRKIDFD